MNAVVTVILSLLHACFSRIRSHQIWDPVLPDWNPLLAHLPPNGDLSFACWDLWSVAPYSETDITSAQQNKTNLQHSSSWHQFIVILHFNLTTGSKAAAYVIFHLVEWLTWYKSVGRCQVIIAAELLKNADELVKAKIHPTSVISGYRLACKYVWLVTSSLTIRLNCFIRCWICAEISSSWWILRWLW